MHHWFRRTFGVYSKQPKHTCEKVRTRRIDREQFTSWGPLGGQPVNYLPRCGLWQPKLDGVCCFVNPDLHAWWTFDFHLLRRLCVWASLLIAISIVILISNLDGEVGQSHSVCFSFCVNHSSLSYAPPSLLSFIRISSAFDLDSFIFLFIYSNLISEANNKC